MPCWDTVFAWPSASVAVAVADPVSAASPSPRVAPALPSTEVDEPSRFVTVLPALASAPFGPSCTPPLRSTPSVLPSLSVKVLLVVTSTAAPADDRLPVTSWLRFAVPSAVVFSCSSRRDPARPLAPTLTSVVLRWTSALPSTTRLVVEMPVRLSTPSRASVVATSRVVTAATFAFGSDRATTAVSSASLASPFPRVSRSWKSRSRSRPAASTSASLAACSWARRRCGASSRTVALASASSAASPFCSATSFSCASAARR